MGMLCPNSHATFKGSKHTTALVNRSSKEFLYAVHDVLLLLCIHSEYLSSSYSDVQVTQMQLYHSDRVASA
jgi:hypothetical protein